MNTTHGRRFNLKLSIPAEASNFTQNQKNEQDELNLPSFIVARERRTSSFTKVLEPSFYEPFYFLYIASPDVGAPTEDVSERIHTMVTQVNKLKPLPKFIAICGGLMGANSKTGITNGNHSLGEALDRLDTSVKVICVPSAGDFDQNRGRKSIDEYRSIYGEDWYGFWVCGVSFIVVNSVYFQSPLNSSLEALRIEQDDWLDSELVKQQIFNAQWTIVLQDMPVCRDLETQEVARHVEKCRESGVSHFFCRQSDDQPSGELKPEDIVVVESKINQNDDTDWRICLAKVSAEKIDYRCMALEDLPAGL